MSFYVNKKYSLDSTCTRVWLLLCFGQAVGILATKGDKGLNQALRIILVLDNTLFLGFN